MQIFTADLTAEHLDNIADAMGIQIYNYRHTDTRVRGKYKGKQEHAFVLRPTGVTRRWTRGGNGIPGNMGKNRLWAISWAGHYVFMRALLNLDPDAVIKSAMNEFHGFHDFDASAYRTGERNIGSMVRPQEYWDSQFEEHVEWYDEEDLIRLTREVLDSIGNGVVA
jgi:hypothetical protein